MLSTISVLFMLRGEKKREKKKKTTHAHKDIFIVLQMKHYDICLCVILFMKYV